ncbi:MAG: argininosuccinate synthase [Candidatus Obscuribacterales bacterium]
MKKVLLAYSGGLDTSCILKWIKTEYDAEIVAYCADVGQEEDFEALKAKAIKCGAIECIVDDLKAEFAAEYIFPAVKAGTVYEKEYLLGTSLARPCIAKGMVEAALRNNCDAIAHGATGKGNDQVRFELAVKALAPHLSVLAPWRIWPYEGRTDLFDYAEAHGIELPITKEKPYSMDANLMHISYEGGILEDPWLEPPQDMFLWTKSPEDAPDAPEYVEIEFQAGSPVAVNGTKLSPLAVVETLNELGARHGIGRVDIVENRYIGIKSRGVYETPGVTILYKAHQAIESLTQDKEVAHLKEGFAAKLAELIYNGYWFAPETKILLNAIEDTQMVVTGTAKIKLYKGNATLVGRKAPASLYSTSLSSFESMSSASEFSPADSGGFININGLRLSTWSKVNESIEKGIHATA